jgi:hypothetical protein
MNMVTVTDISANACIKIKISSSNSLVKVHAISSSEVKQAGSAYVITFKKNISIRKEKEKHTPNKHVQATTIIRPQLAVFVQKISSPLISVERQPF